MRVRFVVAAALLVVAAIPAPVGAQVTPRVEGVVAEVQEETWQDEPAFDGATGQEVPQTPFLQGVYSNPYYNASHGHAGSIGSYLGVTVTLDEVSSDPTSEDAANYVITAEIRINAEDGIDAKLTKQAPDEFLAEFDLDGSVAEGRSPLPPGTYDLYVEVYRISSDPIHGAELVARSTEPVTHDPGRPTSSFMSLFPTDNVRKWRGIGGLEHVPMTGQVGIDEPVEVAFSFPASANQTATIAAYVATVRSPTDSGDVTVEREVLTSRKTSASGSIRKSFQPGHVLDAKSGDVIVVAAYLSGDALEVGSSVIAIPASNRASTVTGYQPTGIGGPAGESVDGFEATVVDESGGSSSTDAVALTRSGTLIAEARNVRQDSTSSGRYYANFAYSDIRDSAATSYRVVAMVYEGTEQDSHEFHSMATASRGFTFVAPFDVQVPPDTSRDIPVSVTSTYTNHDGEDQVQFDMEATISVTGLPRGGNFSTTEVVPEGGEVTVQVPFPAVDPGSYPMTVNISTPDVVASQQITATVPSSSGPVGVPGFTVAPLLAGLVVAALLATRRRE